MKYMGIDYGTKKIGLALSDSSGKMAFPFTLLKNTTSPVDDIVSLVKKEAVGHIILGYSVNNEGIENSVMKYVHEFKKKLEEQILIPVSFQKEFMTSVFARQNFVGKEKNNARQIKQKKVGDDDMAAATLILQRFLDIHNRG
jgi:putative holliday junction resolvase